MPIFDSLPLSADMVADLRSDHAGETGAVAIYRGMLAVSRDPAVRRFAAAHIEAEERHLYFFEHWLPERHHSRLLPLWRAAGWLLGAASALFGRQAAFTTVDAVETFVEKHYVAQIDAMSATPGLESLADTLRAFCEDEVHHRHDARKRRTQTEGTIARGWTRLVSAGSALGVRIARIV